MKGKAFGAVAAAVALLATCLPCSAQTRAGQSPNLNPEMALVKGSVIVAVRNEQGRPLGLPSNVSITLSAPGGPILPYLTQRDGEEWVFPNLQPGVQYTVKVEAPGYQTAEQYVDLPYTNAPAIRVEFYLLPEKGRSPSATAAGGAILAPRAQKEVQQGIKDLQKNKTGSAQKHLAKALKMAPGNPLVNYLMGESWLRAGNVEKAVPYLENAISLDPKQTPALMALGTVRYQQGDMAKAIELLKQAVEAAPESWQAHWLLAAAFLRAGGYEMAREQAESALKYGKEQADPARLILGEALGKLGVRDKALKTFSDYLNRHPNDPRAKQIRGLMAKLRQPPEAAAAGEATPAAGKQPQAGGQAFAEKTRAPAPRQPQPTPTAALVTAPAATPTPPPLATVPAKENWAPMDVDAEKPEIISDATCRLPQILRQAAKRAEELVSDLQKFSATEDFQEVEISRKGGLRRPLTVKFSYLVFIHNLHPHLISVEEMRTPSPAGRLGGDHLVSTGSAALALVFHPDFVKDFDWKCEGMGEWKGQPAWVIHFRQRADRPTSRLHGFETPAGGTLLALKGLVWVAANGDHVLHMETDLVKPVPELQFEREHFAINYTLVRFRTHPVALWLPESVDAYFRYQGHSYHQYSRFSNFQLFWVGTEQKIGELKQNAPNH